MHIGESAVHAVVIVSQPLVASRFQSFGHWKFTVQFLISFGGYIRVKRPNDPSSATQPTRAFDCNLTRWPGRCTAGLGDGWFIGGFLKVAGVTAQQSGVPLG